MLANEFCTQLCDSDIQNIKKYKQNENYKTIKLLLLGKIFFYFFHIPTHSNSISIIKVDFALNIIKNFQILAVSLPTEFRSGSM